MYVCLYIYIYTKALGAGHGGIERGIFGLPGVHRRAGAFYVLVLYLHNYLLLSLSLLLLLLLLLSLLLLLHLLLLLLLLYTTIVAAHYYYHIICDYIVAA